MEPKDKPLVESVLATSGLNSKRITYYGANGKREDFDVYVAKALKIKSRKEMVNLLSKMLKEAENNVFDSFLRIDLATNRPSDPNRRVLVQVRIDSFENFRDFGCNSRAALIGKEEMDECHADLFLHMYRTTETISKCWILFQFPEVRAAFKAKEHNFKCKTNSINNWKQFYLIPYDFILPYALVYNMSGFPDTNPQI